MSQRFTGVPRGFRDVDAHERSDQFGDYLAHVASLIALEKAHSHDLMEPSPGKVLLDVGCGRGDDVRALAGRVAPTGRVIGIDRSATLIHEARGAGPVPGPPPRTDRGCRARPEAIAAPASRDAPRSTRDPGW